MTRPPTAPRDAAGPGREDPSRAATGAAPRDAARTPAPPPRRRPLIAVLGASGLLGTAITRHLADRPVRLRLVARRATAVAAGRAEVETHQVDLTNPGALAAAVADADAVVHLVAYRSGAGSWRRAETDPTAERVNLGLVHELIDVLRDRPRPPVVVFTGSTSQATVPAASRASAPPVTAYDRHKLAAERALEAATARGLLRAVPLRLSTIYCAGHEPPVLDRGVVAAMTRRAVRGQPLTMWHDGSVRRDLLCADDAARAVVAALDHAAPLAGRHWSIGTGRATSVAALFTAIARVVAAHTGRPPVPVVSSPAPRHLAPSDLLDCVADPAPFQRATGWAPRITLAAGLAGLARAVAGDPAPSARPLLDPHPGDVPDPSTA